MNRPTSPPEWTAQELARRLEDREEIHILDVRAPFRLASGRIDTVPADRFHNIPGSELMQLEDVTRAGLPASRPIAVVCGRGNDSRTVAGSLNSRGLQSISLRGGMSAWMAMAVPRELDPPPACERFVQFDRLGKGALGYALISDGEALLVDPSRHVEAMLPALGTARVVAVADTHAHADYVSGAPELAAQLQVPYYLHPQDALYPYDGTPGTVSFSPAEAGTEIPVGRLRVRVVPTPGHTLGSVSYLVGDSVALTGDFLFVDSVGRPDLGEQTEVWTRMLWKSLDLAREQWPADLRIYPAHYATESERNEDRTVGRTLGRIRMTNDALAFDSEARFLEWILSKAGSFPDAYRRIKAINVGLMQPTDAEIDELEAGRNQCALG